MTPKVRPQSVPPKHLIRLVENAQWAYALRAIHDGGANLAPCANMLLWYAARSEAPTRVLKVLLDLGASPTSRDASGSTAMHLATRHASTRSLALFLAHGASPDPFEAASSETPLYWAIRHKHLAHARLLMRHGAKRAPQNHQHATPLHYAPDARTVRFLVAAGATVDATCDTADRTPLHVACLNGQHAVATALLQAGAAPDREDGDGDTPLFLCARGHYPGVLSCFRALHTAGATLSYRNARGMGFLDVVEQVRDAELKMAHAPALARLEALRRVYREVLDAAAKDRATTLASAVATPSRRRTGL